MIPAACTGSYRMSEMLLWERKLFRNTQLNPAHKLLLIALQETIFKSGLLQDERGFVRISLLSVAAAIGMSVPTVVRGIRYFEEQFPGLLLSEGIAQTFGGNSTRGADVQSAWQEHIYVKLNASFLIEPD